MTGEGIFRMQTSTYVQPTMVAFDPSNANNLAAGSADAGIFFSHDNGAFWTNVTNNSGDAVNPVIPRTHWAYFDHECSTYNVFVGTQGRGAWHLSYPDPAGKTVSACQASCSAVPPNCLQLCAEVRASCLGTVGKPGGQLASQCAQGYASCTAGCNNRINACRQQCVDCPQ